MIFLYYKKNQADNFIFECVGEKLFSSLFTVTALYYILFYIEKIENKKSTIRSKEYVSIQLQPTAPPPPGPRGDDEVDARVTPINNFSQGQ